MNRIIKFRGQRVDNKEWVYGYYILREEESPVIETTETYKQHLICTYDLSGLNEFEVTQETVGQFTGLKDCEGVDIYEGDLCKKERQNELYEIVMDRAAWTIKNETEKAIWTQSFCNGAIAKKLEVIGNIHNK
jgi:uncharacterized phage protein (TIGR01671 family)